MQLLLKCSLLIIHPLTCEVTTQTTVLKGKVEFLVAPLTVGIHPLHHPFNIYIFYDDSDCSLEDNLQYPPEIHCLHKDYPMALAIMTINEDTLSNVHKIFIDITTTRKQATRKQISRERFQGCTNSPIYRHRRTTTENLVGVEQIPNNIVEQDAQYGYDNSRLFQN